MSNLTETSDFIQKFLLEGLWSYFSNDSVEKKKKATQHLFALSYSSVPYPGNISCHNLQRHFMVYSVIYTGVKIPYRNHD